MQLSLLNNPSATSASHNLSKAMDAHRRSLARLSSGNRIINPADDAGGLAVGNKLDSKLSRLEKVHQNLKNTISFTELQESALRTVGVIITRMSELNTMSMDVTKNSSDIENYNKEFVELQKQIEAMTKHKFNGVSLFSNTSKFAETDADGRSGHGVDLARNFVFDEYVAESGAVLGQGTAAVGSGADESLSPYTLDQWRADYDQWINHDDSDWDNQYEVWKLNPAPYGGLDLLQKYKNMRDLGSYFVASTQFWTLGLSDLSTITDYTPFAGMNVSVLNLSYMEKGTDYSFVASFKNLSNIFLNGHGITDLRPFAGLEDSGFRSFDFSNNAISDLSPLANLTDLHGLTLENNNISNLEPLAGLTKLNTLKLSGNPITQSQKDMLEAALPSTTITWPDTILPDPDEPESATTTTSYPSLDQFTAEDFTNFTQSVASAMAEVGSHQSRLNMEVRQNESARVNLEAAKSRIMDADIAQESSRYAKTNVLVQSSASMVAKANQLSDIALRLIVNR